MLHYPFLGFIEALMSVDNIGSLLQKGVAYVSNYIIGAIARDRYYEYNTHLISLKQS